MDCFVPGALPQAGMDRAVGALGKQRQRGPFKCYLPFIATGLGSTNSSRRSLQIPLCAVGVGIDLWNPRPYSPGIKALSAESAEYPSPGLGTNRNGALKGRHRQAMPQCWRWSERQANLYIQTSRTAGVGVVIGVGNQKSLRWKRDMF